ncbi:MAG: alpha/beta hydrolase [Lachnospiraceae bacterium]|nr:alpha/beta hydrolase [Lachnospiraceae bacterium]
MQQFTFDVTSEGSAPGARLETYIQNYSEVLQTTERPLILVLPGGGYTHLSPREGEPMAFQYCAMGYHAAVLYYSLAPEATYPAQIYEVAKAVALIRSHAQEWHVDPDKIIIQGCSAGAHLAALYGCIWKQDFIAEKIGLKSEDRDILKPNGQILCYPVITSGGFAHRGSFDSLCGGDEALAQKLSVENLVNADTPKTFIWHTQTDNAVPVENSLLMAAALQREHISFELHIYPTGRHGLGLATWYTQSRGGSEVEPQCQSWIGLVKTWLEHF